MLLQCVCLQAAMDAAIASAEMPQRVGVQDCRMSVYRCLICLGDLARWTLHTALSWLHVTLERSLHIVMRSKTRRLRRLLWCTLRTMLGTGGFV